MTSQIIKRLRGFDVDLDLCNEAADEIERLEGIATEQCKLIDDIFCMLLKYTGQDNVSDENVPDKSLSDPGSDEWINETF